MKLRTHLFIVIMFLLTVCSYAGTLPTYDVMELPPNIIYPAGYIAFNNNRQLLTDSFMYENGVVFSFLKLPIADFRASDINDIGQIIGVANRKSYILYNGELTQLDVPDGAGSSPRAINNNGQVVGVYSTPDEVFHAALWENGTVKDLGVPGSIYCVASDINDKGQIIGYYTTGTKWQPTNNLYLYEKGEIYELGVDGTLCDINEAGQILIIENTGKRRVVIWDNGEIIDTGIRNPIRNTGTIGEQGQVFIDYSLWTRESGIVEISALIPDLIPDEGVTDVRFYCMNSKNEMICKVYTTSILVPSNRQMVMPPLLSYEPGFYSRPIEVEVTCATENAVIHYTTNGSDPTETDPIIESGDTILVDKDTIIKAKAWRSDCVPSSVRYSEYFIREKKFKGLAMVSIPAIPHSNDPKLAVSFLNNYWYTYNPVTKSYIGYPDQQSWLYAPFYETRGFWAKFDKETPVPEGEYMLTETRYIGLKPGWNMIGQPYVSAFKWDPSKINISGKGKLNEAADYVYPYVWGWKQSVVNPYTGSYYRVGDPSVYPDATDIMAPFEGYWIKAKKECVLYFNLPGEK
ncbi:MAG: chitobiase/beta-hexosaminidase C-terminal domain-containing protein [Armatimonadota bacterium]